MCYDIKASLETQLIRAKRLGDDTVIAEIEELLLPKTDLPVYHASGFSHPSLLIYTEADPNFPTVATWGLVPFWVKSEDQQKQIWNQTLNARCETLFEKPAFRDAATHQRCLLYVDGFYEHHHFKGKTYPFFIGRKDGNPLILGGVYSDWRNPDSGTNLTSFTIVTTPGNSLMERIHNNPKLAGPRMPLILVEDQANSWLQPNHPLLKASLENIMLPFSQEVLEVHTVARLRGKSYLGNVPEVSNPVEYSEFEGL